MYHNSLNHEGEKLRSYEQKAMSQDERILFVVQFSSENWFGCFEHGFTPSEINKIVLPEAPITSVRRSMNTLTRQGKLIKTDETRMGPYNRPETVWRLADPVQTDLF